MKKIFLTGFLSSTIVVSSVILVPAITLANTGPDPVTDSILTTQTYTPPANTSSSDSNTYSCSTITSTGLKGLVGCVKGILNDVVVLIVSISVVVVMWGAFTMLSSEDKRKSGRETVIYGIIGLFVMVSVWGFVNILDSTFNLSKQNPIKPQPFTIQ